MSTERLTTILAQKVMRWGIAPNRFLLGNRHWITKTRFQPLKRIEDAFKLLRKLGCDYSLTRTGNENLRVTVRIGSRIGVATAASEPMAIGLAVAQAVGIDTQEVD
jgi:hypothetical protein